MSKQTELTVGQRLEAYKYVKETFRGDIIGPFLCGSLKNWVKAQTPHTGYISNQDLPKWFPEFIKRQPQGLDSNDIWFPETESGNLQREALLDECIKECEQQLLTIKSTAQ